MFDDLITLRAPPPNRVGTCEGDAEQHLSEGAVMMAFAMHLLRAVPLLTRVGPSGRRAWQAL